MLRYMHGMVNIKATTSNLVVHGEYGRFRQAKTTSMEKYNTRVLGKINVIRDHLVWSQIHENYILIVKTGETKSIFDVAYQNIWVHLWETSLIIMGEPNVRVIRYIIMIAKYNEIIFQSIRFSNQRYNILVALEETTWSYLVRYFMIYLISILPYLFYKMSVYFCMNIYIPGLHISRICIMNRHIVFFIDICYAYLSAMMKWKCSIKMHPLWTFRR